MCVCVVYVGDFFQILFNKTALYLQWEITF